MNSYFWYLWFMAAFLSQIAVVSGAQQYSDKGCRIFFSREFPGSIPEYFEVEVEMTGKVSYREDPQDEPLKFDLATKDRFQLSEYVQALDYFRLSLTHPRKVAFTGDKTFRYIDAEGKSSETRFNHTENRDAKVLISWFLKVSETVRHRIVLKRSVKFDRLGVNKCLLQLQVSLDKGRIISPKQMLPILTRIYKDKKIIRLSRSRAAALAHRIAREIEK